MSLPKGWRLSWPHSSGCPSIQVSVPSQCSIAHSVSPLASQSVTLRISQSTAPAGPMDPAGRLVATTQIPPSTASAAIVASLRRNVIDSMSRMTSKCFSTFLLLPFARAPAGPVPVRLFRPPSPAAAPGAFVASLPAAGASGTSSAACWGRPRWRSWPPHRRSAKPTKSLVIRFHQHLDHSFLELVEGEHLKMIQAIKSCDQERLEDLISLHVRQAKNQIVKTIQARESAFSAPPPAPENTK